MVRWKDQRLWRNKLKPPEGSIAMGGGNASALPLLWDTFKLATAVEVEEIIIAACVVEIKGGDRVRELEAIRFCRLGQVNDNDGQA